MYTVAGALPLYFLCSRINKVAFSGFGATSSNIFSEYNQYWRNNDTNNLQCNWKAWAKSYNHLRRMGGLYEWLVILYYGVTVISLAHNSGNDCPENRLCFQGYLLRLSVLCQASDQLSASEIACKWAQFTNKRVLHLETLLKCLLIECFCFREFSEYEIIPNKAFITLERSSEGIYVCNTSNEGRCELNVSIVKIQYLCVK